MIAVDPVSAVAWALLIVAVTAPYVVVCTWKHQAERRMRELPPGCSFTDGRRGCELTGGHVGPHVTADGTRWTETGFLSTRNVKPGAP